MVTIPRLDTYSAADLDEVRRFSPAFQRYEQLLNLSPGQTLHHNRHEAWLKCATATVLKRASTAEICRFWSETADQILQKAWREAGLEGQGAALFALGKHGAQELNLSSDIDLLVVGDAESALLLEKGLRAFQARIQNVADMGFCFRLDFDLRPGGKMGPLITSPSQFQDYYWSQGETWERLALVRLRPVTGAPDLVSAIEDQARRFSYRKFLDFTLLDDLKALRARVHQFGFQRRAGEIHIKLEVGGIRDIELFVHSLLILNGGKIPRLRTRSTSEALAFLRDQGLLTAGDAQSLLDNYWHFRHVENLVQAVEDRQTHFVPVGLDVTLGERMATVDRIVTGLLGAAVPADGESRLPATDDGQSAWLEDLGFSRDAIQDTWPRLISSTALSHKNDRDERARQEFLYLFVQELSRQPGRDLGLGILEDFVRATRAKATFFTMLLRSPRLIQDLARLFCLSPYLGSILAARPELLDHFILQSDDPWAGEMDQLLLQMNDRKLLTEIWAANQFLSDRDLGALNSRITAMADEICRQLLWQLKTEYPGAQLEIVTMGKWAGTELGVRSDLDFIFVSNSKPTEEDAKVARRFISRLADPHKGGHLYEVDLRLRPSGQSGALLVERDQLHLYWKETAEPWERQAYLRARPLDGRIELDKNLLFARSLTTEDLAELLRIRSKLLVPLQEDKIDLKYAPGGLLDIEFVVQTAVLQKQNLNYGCSTSEMLMALIQADPVWAADGAKLAQHYRLLRVYEQVMQLSAAHRQKYFERGKPAFARMASLLNLNPENAWIQLVKVLRDSRDILNVLDPTGLRL